jgi:SAM-dependent methyltransferase
VDPATLPYGCDLGRLPPELGARFVRLDADAKTLAFLAAAPERRHGRAMTFLQILLCQVCSDFDANAILGVYPMHLLSSAQWEQLLGGRPGGALLDVGAGSGDVTRELAPLFDSVTTTDTSRAMAWRLGRRGFACLRTDVATHGVPGGPYDTIACLNVLDRCARPLSLLRRIHAALPTGGRLILSLPLPYAPIAYDGPSPNDPAEPLPLEGESFELGVTSLVEAVLSPTGFDAEAISRAPYLSGGDSRKPLYVLDSAIVVGRRR